jgi:hypothetical protein
VPDRDRVQLRGQSGQLNHLSQMHGIGRRAAALVVVKETKHIEALA